MAMHHLNIRCTKWLDIGLFESVIYTRQNHFEVQYLNPIIFYKAIQNSLGSPDKSDVGLDYKLNFLHHLQWYGQVLFDEFNFKNLIRHNGWWANKWAIQTGLKYVDAFSVPNLDLQAEFNLARPYTFTHNDSASTYTHYNQPLGHPLGANFWEVIAIAKYQLLPELKITGKVIYYEKGLDTATANYGGDIFRPYISPTTGGLDVNTEFGNKLGQGIKDRVVLVDILISYQIRHNLYADFNFIFRHSTASEYALKPYEFYEKTGIMFGCGLRYNIPYRGHDY